MKKLHSKIYLNRKVILNCNKISHITLTLLITAFATRVIFSIVLYISLSIPPPFCCRPRLGALLHRVVGVGLLYLLFSIIEGVLRVNTVRRVSQLKLNTVSLKMKNSDQWRNMSTFVTNLI